MVPRYRFPGVNVIPIGGDPMSEYSHEEDDSRMLVHVVTSHREMALIAIIDSLH